MELPNKSWFDNLQQPYNLETSNVMLLFFPVNPQTLPNKGLHHPHKHTHQHVYIYIVTYTHTYIHVYVYI